MKAGDAGGVGNAGYWSCVPLVRSRQKCLAAAGPLLLLLPSPATHPPPRAAAEPKRWRHKKTRKRSGVEIGRAYLQTSRPVGDMDRPIGRLSGRQRACGLRPGIEF